MKSKLFKFYIILLLVLPAMIIAKDNKVTGFFDKYSQLDDVTYVNFKGFNAKFGNPDYDELMKKIKSVKILSSKQPFKSKDQKQSASVDLFNEAVKQLPLDEYETFLEVKEKGSMVRMLYKTKGDIVDEMLMLIKEKEESTIIMIDGSINIDDLSKIPNMINMKHGSKGIKGGKK